MQMRNGVVQPADPVCVLVILEDGCGRRARHKGKAGSRIEAGLPGWEIQAGPKALLRRSAPQGAASAIARIIHSFLHIHISEGKLSFIINIVREGRIVS